MKNNLIHVFLLSLVINIYGCSPAGILASSGATGMVVAEGDRSLGTVVDDATIKVNIAAKFINSSDNLFVDISTTVLIKCEPNNESCLNASNDFVGCSFIKLIKSPVFFEEK